MASWVIKLFNLAFDLQSLPFCPGSPQQPCMPFPVFKLTFKTAWNRQIQNRPTNIFEKVATKLSQHVTWVPGSTNKCSGLRMWSDQKLMITKKMVITQLSRSTRKNAITVEHVSYGWILLAMLLPLGRWQARFLILQDWRLDGSWFMLHGWWLMACVLWPRRSAATVPVLMRQV